MLAEDLVSKEYHVRTKYVKWQNVDGLFRQGDRFVVRAGKLRLEGENVVVATGGY